MDAISDPVPAVTQDSVFALIRSKQAQIAQAAGAKPVEGDSKLRTQSGVQNVQNSSTENGVSLSKEDQQVVDQLKKRDREVRDHENAHTRAGGAYASQPSYSYQTGPDGKRYAVGGEVQIDASPVANDPAATIDKMIIVKAAALAPAEPSSADRKVAAMADVIRGQAQAELNELRAAERRGEALDTRI